MAGNKADIYDLPASTNWTPEQALKSSLEFAYEGRLKEVMIIGVLDDDTLLVRSSKMDRKEALWLSKQAELHTLKPVIQQLIESPND